MLRNACQPSKSGAQCRAGSTISKSAHNRPLVQELASSNSTETAVDEQHQSQYQISAVACSQQRDAPASGNEMKMCRGQGALVIKLKLPADADVEVGAESKPKACLRIQLAGQPDIVVDEAGFDYSSAKARRTRGKSVLTITCPCVSKAT